MPIELSDLEIVDIDHQKFDCSTFDCADADLNDFLKSDCLNYIAHGLSYTKLALLNGEIIGFVALLADSISLEIAERQWLIKTNVHVTHIPALKIGRLGIGKTRQGQGVGRALMKYSLGVAIRLNLDLRVGCRFLTVDAYPDSVGFYEKLGFVKSRHSRYKKRTQPSMHYDMNKGSRFASAE